MSRIRQMRVVSYVTALVVALVYLAPAAGLARGRQKPAAVPPKTLVVFPFEDVAKSPLETLSNDLPQGIQSGLSTAGAYRAFAFSERLPSVQRAVLETTLRKEDLKGPFGIEADQLANALKVTREMAADMMLVGTIDDVKCDPATKKAQVTLTAVVADGRTGEAAKTVAVTGETPASTKSSNANDLIAQAAGDAVTKIVKEIAPQQATATTQAVAPRRASGIRKLILPLLIGVAVGLVASASGGSSGSGAIDNPPPSPF